jgi:hypothetical protein
MFQRLLLLSAFVCLILPALAAAQVTLVPYGAQATATL